ncbi:vitelline membrane outer layer protein 1 homolog [Clarias gariepinus]|uniref:vitelline membrane outer layer protein 1 homolog n=1 Tax=Clarias gariepinus TaxID=13013 RepID=UPI00234C4AC8|nr:vitelline membrane outer layer protein 1 homolog [Clarias gariepinus]
MHRLVCSTLVIFLALFGCHVMGKRAQRTADRLYQSLLFVDNGQRWGTWGLKEMCPNGYYAAGFSLKVAGYWESLLIGDNTALNGIRLHCVNSHRGSGPYSDYATVQSDTGSWGKWTDIQWCNSGMLQSFQLRVEPYQGTMWDDTAANNIKFKCSGDDEEIKGAGMSWGDWGSWSDPCTGTGICGIQTIVEEPKGVGDDTALNDVRFYCCE